MESIRVVNSFLALIWKIRPSYFLQLIFKSLAEAGSIVLDVFMTKFLIEGLVGGASINELIKTLLVFTIFKFIFRLSNSIIKARMEKESKLLQNQVVYEFSQKSFNLDYSSLEDPNILDLRERAIFAVNNHGAIGHFVNGLESILLQLIIGTSMGSILFKLSPYYLAIIIILVIISMALSSYYFQKSFNLTQDIIPVNRVYAYYINTAIDDINQKDYRLYDMAGMMSGIVKDLNYKTAGWLDNMSELEARSSIGQSILSYALTFISYSYISVRALTDSLAPRIGLGDFVMNVNATERFFLSFQELGNSIFMLRETINNLKPFYEFMELEESKDEFGDKDIEEFESIEFRNVSFTYPNSNRLILDNISFKINKGEKISIVGINNAGKTTIIKLICGFFQVDSGEIILNSRNIRDYNYDSYMAMIAAVFQDFKLFPFTIRENIQDEEAADDLLLEVLDKLDILDLVEGLPKALDSQIEKSIYEDAVNFSGGEKQKLAIARALYKDADLIILDEPTAALDPLAESEIYENFNTLVEDKTAIYISHRMSSSIFCDKILLIDDGKLKAFDSHKNLMKKDNKYRELFLTQAKNFQ